MRVARCVAFATGLIVLPMGSFAALFTDDFSGAYNPASYNVVSNNIADSFPDWAYNYGTLGIPSAPRSGDSSTLGVRLNANVAAGAAGAVTLHTVPQFTGDYTVKFDAWINVNGPFPDGGSGSTNYLGAGVGGNGTTNNFVTSTGSGGWTAVNGENGSGIDYRLYKAAALQAVTGGQYAAGTATNARNGLNGYYNQFGGFDISNYPVQGANNGGPAQQNGTSFLGSFGMGWHTVTLYVDEDGAGVGQPTMAWFADGLRLGTLSGGFTSNGSVTLSYSDPTANVSDNPPLSYVLIDNLTVEAGIPEPTTLMLALPAMMFLAARRRR
jgi:hypothetical protein